MYYFESVLKFVLNHKGGYVNITHDKGGETKFGISDRSDCVIKSETPIASAELWAFPF